MLPNVAKLVLSRFPDVALVSERRSDGTFDHWGYPRDSERRTQRFTNTFRRGDWFEHTPFWS